MDRAQLAQTAQVLGGPAEGLLVGAAGGELEAGSPVVRRGGDPRVGNAGQQGAGGVRGGVGGVVRLDDGPPARFGGGAEPVDGALGDEPAGADDDDAVAQALDEVELVGGEEGGHTGSGALAQHGAHDVDRHRVQAGEGLVEDEQVGAADEGGGELDALLVAQGEPLDLVVAAPGDAEALGPLPTGPAGGGGVDAVEPGEVGQLLADPHPGVQAALLGHVADAAADPGVDRCAVPGHRARVGGERAHDDAHGGGLAGAVGPHEADQLVVVQGEGQGVEGLKAPEALGQASDHQHESSGTGRRNVKFP